MEQVTIWYLHDSAKSEELIKSIEGMGLLINAVKGYDLKKANIVEHEINIFIFDVYDITAEMILKTLSEDSRIHGCLKFVILNKKEMKAISKIDFNMLHIEFITRPVTSREFLLLLEKSVLVERYREIMSFISKESEARIETYEGLMDINRKHIFESEKEKKAFEQIIMYEKNLMREQAKLNTAIHDFTLMRQSEYFDLKNRIKAEEMLADLRRKELLEAKNIIEAQESVIDFSATELRGAQQIINAAENASELARKEALELHDEMERLKERIKKLKLEKQQLKQEIEKMKS